MHEERQSSRTGGFARITQSSSRKTPAIDDFVQAKWLAGELGFEPRLTESESAVLPLNYSPTGICGAARDDNAGYLTAQGDLGKADGRSAGSAGISKRYSKGMVS